jgi:lipoprotein NlpD
VVDRSQPPTRKITTHIVSKGENLYSIARRYDLDYRMLARANNIGTDYVIVPGQVLFLRQGVLPPDKIVSSDDPKPVSKPVAKPVRTSSVKKSTDARSKPLTSKTTQTVATANENTAIRWSWPASGPVISRFSLASPDTEGIDIKLKKGESVFAAADGLVVYAGEGIREFGRLLIIKHNKQFLSAYAHAEEIFVAEGSKVQAGQKVAEIGPSGDEVSKLYFEIRRGGEPVDPMRYLPPKK